MREEEHTSPTHDTQHGTQQADAAKGARALAGFVLLFGILAAVGGIVLPLSQLAQTGATVGVSIADADGLLGDLDADVVPEGASLDLAGADGATLVAEELPTNLRILTQLPWTLAGALLLTGAWLLRRMLLDIAAGRPFDPRMPGRLRGLAVVVLAGTLFPGLLEGVASVVVTQHLGGLPDGSPLAVPLFDAQLTPPLLVVALLIVAAQVFESGRQLTDDVQGLV